MHRNALRLNKIWLILIIVTLNFSTNQYLFSQATNKSGFNKETGIDSENSAVELNNNNSKTDQSIMSNKNDNNTSEDSLQKEETFKDKKIDQHETKEEVKSNENSNDEAKPKEKNKFPWHILLTGLIGALIGLSPYLYEKYKPQKFYGKIIGFNYYPDQSTTFEVDLEGNKEKVDGFGYRYKMNLISNKDVNIEKIKVYVSFGDQFIEGRPYYINGQFPDLKPDDFIQLTPMIKEQQTHTKYLNFIVKNEDLKQRSKFPELVQKLENKDTLIEEDWTIIRREFGPKKLKIVFQKFNQKDKELVMDIENKFDFYSIVPEN